MPEVYFRSIQWELGSRSLGDKMWVSAHCSFSSVCASNLPESKDRKGIKRFTFLIGFLQATLESRNPQLSVVGAGRSGLQETCKMLVRSASLTAPVLTLLAGAARRCPAAVQGDTWSSFLPWCQETPVVTLLLHHFRRGWKILTVPVPLPVLFPS